MTATATLRRAAALLTTPLLPEDFLSLLDPLASGSELRARVVDLVPETADAVTVVLRPRLPWPGHRPGQYVRVGIEVDGVRMWRAYSLTSVPGRADGCLSITVKSIPDGRVSQHIVRRLAPGAIVRLEGPEGEFVQPADLPAGALFITGGSGITPVMGMLRSHRLPDTFLIHSACTRAEVIFGEELRALAESGRLRLLERHTDAEGMLDLAELDQLCPDWRDRDAWVCGPAGLLTAAESHWATAGLETRLRTERFRPLVLAAAGDGGSVCFAGSDRSADADGATTLLDVGERAGVLMPSGCRMGICRGCVVPLLSGQVRDLRTGDVTRAQPGDTGTYVQTCVSAAAGPCTIAI
jgi:ferredoxin-NADP reductase